MRFTSQAFALALPCFNACGKPNLGRQSSEWMR